MQRLLARAPRARALSTLPTLPLTTLTAVTGADGRYAAATAPLRPYLSEYALIKHRVLVEVEWLRVLARAGTAELPALDADSDAVLRDIAARFDGAGAARVKAIEATTNHDVKAVEYFLKEAVAASGNARLRAAAEFLHFAATSEDVNNAAYALMVKGARDDVLLPALRELLGRAVALAEALADAPMLSRTHGQPATPTTMGKEWANFAHRLARAIAGAAAVAPLAKFNGAVGNFNAHVAAYPRLDWERAARELVEGRLGLALAPYSTQIECHDWLAELFHALARANTVVLALDRDAWGYISLGYFRQRRVAGEVGSSTMPHKVNPIDFENSEGNAGLANATLEHLAGKLPVSRFQRDLSDSTALRAIGGAFAHTLIAAKSAAKGVGKLDADRAVMLVRARARGRARRPQRLTAPSPIPPPPIQADLDSRWEVLAEPIQTVMRRYGAREPYEQLKELTRGRGAFDAAGIRAFVEKIAAEGQVPPAAAAELRALTPATYLGLAPQLARGVRAAIEAMGVAVPPPQQ